VANLDAVLMPLGEKHAPSVTVTRCLVEDNILIQLGSINGHSLLGRQ
jgi:hypothetical protein